MQTAMQSLGDFLRALRLRLDPTAFGFAAGRRRTSGLRREEVAQLACISPTWYTWLEQGRGGAPSREVLNRIASGLRLTSSNANICLFWRLVIRPTRNSPFLPMLRRVYSGFWIRSPSRRSSKP